MAKRKVKAKKKAPKKVKKAICCMCCGKVKGKGGKWRSHTFCSEGCMDDFVRRGRMECVVCH